MSVPTKLGLAVGVGLVLAGLDRLLAIVAVELEVASAVLSPGGVNLEGLALAGLFLLVRFALLLYVAGALAWTAASAVRTVIRRERAAAPESQGRQCPE